MGRDVFRSFYEIHGEPYKSQCITYDEIQMFKSFIHSLDPVCPVVAAMQFSINNKMYNYRKYTCDNITLKTARKAALGMVKDTRCQELDGEWKSLCDAVNILEPK